jgi:hypothetical protein
MSEERITELEDRLLLSVFNQAIAIICENTLSKKQADKLYTLQWKVVNLAETSEGKRLFPPHTFGDGCIVIPKFWVDAILKKDKRNSWALFYLTYTMVHEILHCLNPKKSEDAVEAETSRFFRKAMNGFLHRMDELAYMYADGS